MVQVHPPEDRAGSVHESPVRRVVRPGPMHGGSPGAPVAGARQCPVLHRGAVAHLVLPELVVVPQGCGVRRSVRRFRRGGRPQPRGRGKVHGVGGGSSKTQRAGSLLAAIGARLGTRVQLAEVVARLTATSCWCTSAPKMPESDLLALQEWVQTVLWALEAERADGCRPASAPGWASGRVTGSANGGCYLVATTRTPSGRGVSPIASSSHAPITPASSLG